MWRYEFKRKQAWWEAFVDWLTQWKEASLSANHRASLSSRLHFSEGIVFLKPSKFFYFSFEYEVKSYFYFYSVFQIDFFFGSF